MKLITFSLWGDDPKYCVGAIRNAELTRKIYPGWLPRFYVGQSVPEDIVKELRQHTDQIVQVDTSGDWTGMFWRFRPASEDDVEVFISRDCDSRLGEREAEAVQEWMDSPRLIHVMRDHPHHSAPIMGGMWGAKREAIPDMAKLMRQWDQEDHWQTDQEFLRQQIWKHYYHKMMVHDDWNRFSPPLPTAANRFFPTPRKDNEFVGAIIGPNEERLHPEHHEGL